jgi:hypothetical protein
VEDNGVLSTFIRGVRNVSSNQPSSQTLILPYQTLFVNLKPYIKHINFPQNLWKTFKNLWITIRNLEKYFNFVICYIAHSVICYRGYFVYGIRIVVFPGKNAGYNEAMEILIPIGFMVIAIITLIFTSEGFRIDPRDGDGDGYIQDATPFKRKKKD